MVFLRNALTDFSNQISLIKLGGLLGASPIPFRVKVTRIQIPIDPKLSVKNVAGILGEMVTCLLCR